MAKRKPTRFETKDGCEFDSLEEAERHEKVVEAKEQFDRAKLALCEALAAVCKTADGQPFEFRSRDYWCIAGLVTFPRLHRVTFWHSYDQRFYVDGSHLVLVNVTHHSNGQKDEQAFRVSELFADERAAKAELRRRRLEYLEDRKKEMETDQ